MYFHIWQLANYTVLHIVPYSRWYSYSVPYIREPFFFVLIFYMIQQIDFYKLVILRHLVFCSLPFFCRPFCFHPSAFSRFSLVTLYPYSFLFYCFFSCREYGKWSRGDKERWKEIRCGICMHTNGSTQRHTKKHTSQRVEEIGLIQKRVRQRGKRTREIFVECKRTFDLEKKTAFFIAQPYRTSSTVTSHCLNVSLSLSWK